MLFSESNEIVLKSLCENPNLDNQETLINAVFSIDDADIQRMLLRKITDENLLADFALNNRNPFIRREAIQNPNLTNLNTISEIIKNDDDELNRVLAIYKIPDGEALLEIIFNKSLYHRLPQIARNTDFLSDDYFLRILKNETDEYLHQVAVSFINDSEILDDIVLNEYCDSIRADAIKNHNFTNQKILNELILNETCPAILLEVVSKIENQELLKNFIVDNLKSDEIIFKAISRVNDIELLNDLSSHHDFKIRMESVKRISQFGDVDAILKDVALTESNEKICLIAISAMKVRNDLIEVVLNRPEKNIRISALKQINDIKLIGNYFGSGFNPSAEESALNEMALNDKDCDIRKIATDKITDKHVLDEIASGGDVNRFEAQKRLNTLFEDIKRIEHEKSLVMLTQNSDNDVSALAKATLDDLYLWEERLSKINEIEDVDALKDIAANDFNYFVRLEAEGKLEKILFHIRLDEIDSEFHQEKLKDIVMDEEFGPEIRNKALLNINDEIFVKKFENIFQAL